MRVAVVSGASTGIGRATVLRLAADGWTVFAGVRSESARRSLVDEGGDRVRPIMLDVADQQAVEAAATRVRAEAGKLDALVNNAGIGIGGPLEAVAREELRYQLEVNVVGQVALSQVMLPLLRASRGRLVFVGSANGRFAGALLAPYAASKHAIEAIADSLRVELRGSQVKVVLVEPGAVRTPLRDKGIQGAEALTLSAELRPLYEPAVEALGTLISRGSRTALSPERVADVIADALTTNRPRARYVVGRDARVQFALKALLPTRVLDALVARMTQL